MAFFSFTGGGSAGFSAPIVLVGAATPDDPNRLRSANLWLINRGAYCLRYGFGGAFAITDPPVGLPRAFIKLAALSAVLPLCPASAWCIWSEGHTLIMDGADYDVAGLLPAPGTADHVFAQDDQGNMSTAHFAVRNTSQGNSIVSGALGIASSYLGSNVQDVAAIQAELTALSLSAYSLSHRTWNSFPQTYQGGDFVLNVHGRDPAENLALMTAYAVAAAP